MGLSLGVCASVSWVPCGFAQSTPATAQALVPFIYDVPEGCPTRPEFEHQVARKLGTDAPSEARTEVHVAALNVTEGQSFSIRITFRPEHGTDRTLIAASCADAVAGAALVIALAIDPTRAATAPSNSPDSAQPIASTSPTASPISESPANSLDTSTLPPTAADPLAVIEAPAAPIETKPLPPTRIAVSPEAPPPAATPVEPWAKLLAGASFGTNNWLGPRLARQFQVFAELEPLHSRWCLRISGSRGDSSATVNGRGASFGAWGARVDFAPYVLGAPERALRLAIAGVVDVASISARGEASSQLAISAAQRFLWVDAGALARLQTPEWYRLRLEVQAELLVPLRRPTFTFDAPYEVIHTPPSLAVGAHVALGVRLF